MKKVMGEIADAEDLVLILRWGIRLALALVVIFVVAVAAGLALQLFEIARGAG